MSVPRASAGQADAGSSRNQQPTEGVLVEWFIRMCSWLPTEVLPSARWKSFSTSLWNTRIGYRLVIERISSEMPVHRVVCDYIAGMTDSYFTRTVRKSIR